ncbi:hypothetical protein LIER_12213 [Lithospermum erythrorhizon]|uniref:Uncharacterized protein n=1 Tax=Lithospermum erythrorhizon TaxID=34254 RepID=A0AAV3PUY2_LITER
MVKGNAIPKEKASKNKGVHPGQNAPSVSPSFTIGSSIDSPSRGTPITTSSGMENYSLKSRKWKGTGSECSIKAGKAPESSPCSLADCEALLSVEEGITAGVEEPAGSV